jgi:hypothetical protein
MFTYPQHVHHSQEPNQLPQACHPRAWSPTLSASRLSGPGWRESWKPAIALGQTCQGRTKQDVLGENEVAGIFVDLAAQEPSPTNVTYLLVLKNMLVYCRRRTLREEGSASKKSDSLYPYSLTALSRKQTRPG